jgi:hypothetical protein
MYPLGDFHVVRPMTVISPRRQRERAGVRVLSQRKQSTRGEGGATRQVRSPSNQASGLHRLFRDCHDQATKTRKHEMY